MKLKINGNECWIKDGVELPSNFDSMNDGEKWGYICENSLLHREDGPAVIYTSGTKKWYIDGKYHRLDGPAVIWNNGIKQWYLYGRKHRLDGPATIWPNGTIFWYLNGIEVDGEIYQKIQNSSKEKLLVYMIDSKYKDYLPLIEYQLNKKG